jgi:hypothetical protein
MVSWLAFGDRFEAGGVAALRQQSRGDAIISAGDEDIELCAGLVRSRGLVRHIPDRRDNGKSRPAQGPLRVAPEGRFRESRFKIPLD